MIISFREELRKVSALMAAEVFFMTKCERESHYGLAHLRLDSRIRVFLIN